MLKECKVEKFQLSCVNSLRESCGIMYVGGKNGRKGQRKEKEFNEGSAMLPWLLHKLVKKVVKEVMKRNRKYGETG